MTRSIGRIMRTAAMSTSTWPWYEYNIDYTPDEPTPDPADVCKYSKGVYLEKYQERAYHTRQGPEVEVSIKKRITGTILEWPLCNYETAPVGLYYKWERDTGGMYVVTPYWLCLPCATRGGKK